MTARTGVEEAVAVSDPGAGVVAGGFWVPMQQEKATNVMTKRIGTIILAFIPEHSNRNDKMLALGVRQTGSGICQIAAVIEYSAVAINRDPDTVLQLGYRDPDPVDHRNSANDSTGDDDRFGFLVDDGSGRMSVPAQGIQDIGADG